MKAEKYRMAFELFSEFTNKCIKTKEQWGRDVLCLRLNPVISKHSQDQQKPHHQKSLLPLWSRQLKNAPCMNAASGRVCTIQSEETQSICRHAIAWSWIKLSRGLAGKRIIWSQRALCCSSYIYSYKFLLHAQHLQGERAEDLSDHLTWGLCSLSSAKATDFIPVKRKPMVKRMS